MSFFSFSSAASCSSQLGEPSSAAARPRPGPRLARRQAWWPRGRSSRLVGCIVRACGVHPSPAARPRYRLPPSTPDTSSAVKSTSGITLRVVHPRRADHRDRADRALARGRTASPTTETSATSRNGVSAPRRPGCPRRSSVRSSSRTTPLLLLERGEQRAASASMRTRRLPGAVAASSRRCAWPATITAGRPRRPRTPARPAAARAPPASSSWFLLAGPAPRARGRAPRRASARRRARSGSC